MSDSDTGETSRFKMKHIEPVTNAEDIATIGNNSQNSSNSQIDYNQTLFTASAQKVDKHKREKIKGRRNHHQNLCHRFQGILSFQENQWRKVILLKAKDFKLYLKLSVTNESFLVKCQIMSITSLNILFQKRM